MKTAALKQWPPKVSLTRLAATKILVPFKPESWVPHRDLLNIQSDIVEDWATDFPAVGDISGVYLQVLGDWNIRIWIVSKGKRYGIGKDPKVVAKKWPQLLQVPCIFVTVDGPPVGASVTLLPLGRQKRKPGEEAPSRMKPPAGSSENQILELIKQKEEATKAGNSKLARKLRKHLRSLGYFHKQRKELKKGFEL